MSCKQNDEYLEDRYEKYCQADDNEKQAINNELLEFGFTPFDDIGDESDEWWDIETNGGQNI
jgi:hypothetical protein